MVRDLKKNALLILLIFAVILAFIPLNVFSEEPGKQNDSMRLKNTSDLHKTLSYMESKAKSKLDPLLQKLSEKPSKSSEQAIDATIKSMKDLKQFTQKGTIIKGTDSKAPEDSVYVYIETKTANGLKDIRPFLNKVTNEDIDLRTLTAWVGLDKLNQLELLPEVINISTVMPPVVRAVTEGYEFHNMNFVRSLGNLGGDGTGIKIGVISDGVNNIQSAYTSKDLDPAKTYVLGNAVGGDEGTAMLEIIYDLAPGAELYFHDCGDNTLAFNAAIDELVNAGCKIVVDDIGWVSQPFFEDGNVAKHVSDVIASKKILYISSAGNAAKDHYQGMYYNDGYNFHDFSRGKSDTKGLYMRLAPGEMAMVIMQWDDLYGSSANDYDLYFFNDNTGEIITSSTGDQSGNGNPFEAIAYTNNTGNTMEIEIAANNYKGLAASKTLELYIVYGTNYLDNITAEDSIFGHPAVPDVISVGAINMNAPSVIADYSSRGPVTMTNSIIRQKKPEISGAAGVSISGAGGFDNPFYGTSAAAPHIAAIAGVVWAKNPGKTYTDIRNAILNNALDMGNVGFDNTFGYGKADALKAFTAINPVPLTISSVTPSLNSPQMIGTTIRWTCNAIGGKNPVYYFQVYKGDKIVANSPAYSSTKYFDWTPTAAGTNYRIRAYVKESGAASSTSINMYSDYYSILYKLNSDITQWLMDDSRDYIYAILEEEDKLLIIDKGDLTIDTELSIGDMPTDVELYNDKLYVALNGENKIAIVNLSTKSIEMTITTANSPYRAVVDGDKLFYTQRDDWAGLYVYDLQSNEENSIFIFARDHEPDLAVDRSNHVLYVGTTGSTGSHITALRTTDFSQVSVDTYNDGYGFSFPGRDTIYDDGYIYYAGYMLDADDLGIVEGKFKEQIIYVNDNLAFSNTTAYERDKYVKIRDLPFTTYNILMDDEGYTYLFDNQDNVIHKEMIDFTLDTSMEHTNNDNSVILDEKLVNWVLDEDRNRICAISREENKLLFISLSDLVVEKEVFIGSEPSDIVLYNNKLYIALYGATKVAVVDLVTENVSTIITGQNPYKIGVDGDKIFYTEYDQWCDLYVHDSSNGSDKKLSVTSFYYPDLDVDTVNHVLYVGSSSTTPGIVAIKTSDYSILAQNSTASSVRKIIYDSGSVYFADFRFSANDLNSYPDRYGETIIYAKGPYLFSKYSLFNRDSYQSIKKLNNVADLALMSDDKLSYLYNSESDTISEEAVILAIRSIAASPASPQKVGTNIRWTCNAVGGTNPVYYFQIYKGNTIVANTSSYTANNYYDWTPTVVGEDYRVRAYVKENGAASSTSINQYSDYYIVKPEVEPIAITSVTASPASPQLVGTTIRWTCNATGGTNKLYYFQVYKGSTIVENTSAYTSVNYYDWKPTVAGEDYRVMAYVKESGTSGSTSVRQYSDYYIVKPDLQPIAITSVTASPDSPQLVGTTIRWTCNATGGTNKLYYFQVYKGSTIVENTSAYTSVNYYDWKPTVAGEDYRVMAYVKESGTSGSTSVRQYSDYYIVKPELQPIAITSVTASPDSPQLVGTTIRWTCNATGGTNKLYYFQVYKGSTIVENTAKYTSTSYYDWTPTVAGEDYRVMAYVKESGTSGSTSVRQYSDYYEIDDAITGLLENKINEMSEQVLSEDKEIQVSIGSFAIVNIEEPYHVGEVMGLKADVAGGTKLLYKFSVYDGTDWIYTTEYTEADTAKWTPDKAGEYMFYVYVKDEGSAGEYDACEEIECIVEEYDQQDDEENQSGIGEGPLEEEPIPESEAEELTVDIARVEISDFTIDLEEPYHVGEVMGLKADAAGGTKLLYKFSVYDGTDWIYTTEYTEADTAKWTPDKAGEYMFYVYVKDEGSAGEYDACEEIKCTVEVDDQLDADEVHPGGADEPSEEDINPEDEVN